MARHTATASRSFLLVAGLLLVAATLRGPVTGVAPVLDLLRSHLGLSPTDAGLLTTLPLVAFAAISPFAALFARKYGIERCLFGALLLIAAGVVVRSTGTVVGLYLGTATVGTGIALGNVLLPGLIKRDFPSRVPVITSVCAVTMGVAAAMVSMSVVPLADVFGWRIALGMVIVFPLAAIAVWTCELGGRIVPLKGTPPKGTPLKGIPVTETPVNGTAAPVHGGGVWRSMIAWQVTLFMGANSTLYYIMVAWLPTILTNAGFTPAAAGSIHGVMQLSCAVPGLVLSLVVGRLKDQRLIAAGTGFMLGISLLGLLFAPAWALLWSALFGFGSGAAIILALMFMSMRARDVHQSAALSGMAQCIGYLLAACGPTLAGKAHDITGNWHIPLAIGVVLSVLMALFGSLAGRSRHIGTSLAASGR
ncbi:MFS transporter [Sodalis ligni]|uniref:MFS transporter n=1 Tax=Sodalis ligni TaxID=2697027 RepID=UPI001BDF6029|nr:MFS transporter [Sodalis ligni]QWA09705.1 MFS transporter [Sodalis ligni]